jgi:hypothetical protein
LSSPPQPATASSKALANSSRTITSLMLPAALSFR